MRTNVSLRYVMNKLEHSYLLIIPIGPREQATGPDCFSRSPTGT